jgi:hypothetical protein
MPRKSPPPSRRQTRDPLDALRDELAALAKACARNAARIDRLELEYATEVRRCAELQAEIDLLKRAQPSRR